MNIFDVIISFYDGTSSCSSEHFASNLKKKRSYCGICQKLFAVFFVKDLPCGNSTPTTTTDKFEDVKMAAKEAGKKPKCQDGTTETTTATPQPPTTPSHGEEGGMNMTLGIIIAVVIIIVAVLTVIVVLRFWPRIKRFLYDRSTSKTLNTSSANDNAQSNQQNEQVQKWKVGDQCMALSEDGKRYPAKIVQISPAKNTCTVSYIGSDQKAILLKLEDIFDFEYVF